MDPTEAELNGMQGGAGTERSLVIVAACALIDADGRVLIAGGQNETGALASGPDEPSKDSPRQAPNFCAAQRFPLNFPTGAAT